ncbi:uncharacterized protein Bfra_005734 [Botrytis fragariae]|uniref:Heterokaryon incompatibility domain-containing protein n=1 Tax=Botrytis fragariae TaxID=1964551 RepID=A0A8H6AS37_9HELO|nr:uncharacterized protein Bfra_005734 [Botrytis fragariae]KAF5872375.1 hypothetical protein Bfra_005734 [Botrytis fragariae]
MEAIGLGHSMFTLNPSIAPRLVEPKGQTVAYAALSYCWGKNGQLRLKKVNHVQFLNALPVQMLSKTTQDAIRVTRALSIKYLWVDALCIIQDSAEDKSRGLAVMGDFYSRSVIAIGAANGDHADAGLFAKRAPHQQRPCPIYEIEDNCTRTQIFAELPRDDEQGTILDSRGWIFQEEVLSARTLKFCSDGLRLKLGFIVQNGSHSELIPWIRNDDILKTDKLPALTGIATQIHNIHKYDHLAGLWKQDLEYGLLWYVASQPNMSSGKKVEAYQKAASSVAEGMNQLSIGNVATHTPFLRNVSISSSGTAQHLKAALPNLRKGDEVKAKSPS